MARDKTEKALALAASEGDKAALAALADWYGEHGKDDMAHACRWMLRWNVHPLKALDGDWQWLLRTNRDRMVRHKGRGHANLHPHLHAALHYVWYATWLAAVRDLAGALAWLRRLTEA